MIRCKTKHKLYVAPEIEVTTYDEENLMAGSVGGHGNDQQGPDDQGGDYNAKSGRFIIIDDFEDEEYVEDDFNYDNYKKQSMLW